MQPSVVASPETAPEGRERIAWVRRHMPLLRGLETAFQAEQPFAGKRALVCIHLEAKTAYLALLLRAGGATVAVTGSNPDSTKDAVVAALAENDVYVYARHGATPRQMQDYMGAALQLRPNLVIDDGGDIVELLHREYRALLPEVIGACEETTTGVLRARARAHAGELAFPVVLVNEARCKYLFDNVHGTGQSVWDAIMRSTNLAIAGKTVVIVGYGWCGRGCALRARGLGAQVIVCEVDPVKAADAAMTGYRVMPLLAACAAADFLVTTTGVRHTLAAQHFQHMKDGVLIANAGHFRHEIDVAGLRAYAAEVRRLTALVDGCRAPDGRWIHLLGDGNIVNIACADGHPAEIMDTSFALQALCARHLVRSQGRLAPGVHAVPADIDDEVARLKLASMGIEIDRLTDTQRAYLAGWEP